ncbi:MAG: agmatinase [Candidatus Nezhaarchaeales archaeon]
MKQSFFYVNQTRFTFGGLQAPLQLAPIVVVGVPFDSTASYRPGARFAPAVVREVSMNLETFSWRVGIDLEDVKMHDLGDVNVVHGDVNETLHRVEEVVKEIRDMGKIPVLIGGEHTITYAAFKALRAAAILVFDAHMDLRDEYPPGQRLSHATVMRRMIELIGPKRLIQVGVRAACKEEVEYAGKIGLLQVSSREVEGRGAIELAALLRRRLQNVETVYLSIDVDVLDPSYAPGVSNPEPEGINPTKLLDVLNNVIDRRLIGFDVVEVCPPYDTGLAAAQAAKAIFEVTGMIHRSRRS